MGIALWAAGPVSRLRCRACALAVAVTVSLPPFVCAQTVQPPLEPAGVFVESSYRPITPRERREWFVDATLSPKSLGTGLAMGTLHTVQDSPREWGGTSGFTKRVLTSQANTGISKGLEAGLGSLWGEDPRSTPSRRDGFGSRLGYAMKTVVLAPRPDGHMAPAWGRFAGVVGSNVVMNAWLPSRLTTPGETAERIAAVMAGRLAKNLLTEFGPDLRRKLFKGRKARQQDEREDE